MSLDNDLQMMVETVLLPEIVRVNKPVCICRIENFPKDCKEMINEAVNTMPLRIFIGLLMEINGYNLSITSDCKVLVVIQNEFLEQLITQSFIEDWDMPFALGDFLYEKYTQYLENIERLEK